MSFLQKYIKAHDFKELKIPLVVVATHIEHGELISFSTGSLIPAVMASAAIPGAFYPVKINQDYYIDGGVISPIPVAIAKKFNPEVIIAININEGLPNTEPTNIFGLLKRSLEISYLRNSEAEAKQADLVIGFEFNNIGSFSDQKNQFLYDSGKLAARKALAQVHRLILEKSHK